MTWWLWSALAACVLGGGVLGLSAFGARRWGAEVRTLDRVLEATRRDGRLGSGMLQQFDARELAGLPAPVQRYFRAVLKEGQPMVSALTLDMTGTFNLSMSGDQWRPFASRQRVITHRPGFVWDAQVALAPGVVVHVVDGYIAGEGLLQAAAMGLFTLARFRGGPEMARDEFMRFFAETVWHPTSLLPSQGVQWTAVDPHSARASMRDGVLVSTLLFRFDDAGMVASVYAAARGTMVGKTIEMMPWECTLSDYRTYEGMMVPMCGEVAWLRPEGRRSYFRGNITALNFEFAA